MSEKNCLIIYHFLKKMSFHSYNHFHCGWLRNRNCAGKNCLGCKGGVCDTLSLKPCRTLLFDRKELLWNLIILWLRIAAICFWVTENKGPLFLSLDLPVYYTHNIYEEENDELKHYNERNDYIENPLDNCDYVKKNVRLCISIMKQNEDPICCLFVAGSLLSLV